mmetsp:Transcript_126354/g.252490  ORF Transcript_126354/g.252490 Transcript_126354/m.252490 type:complete len:420 (-) Transcript_126354:107-1366(-)
MASGPAVLELDSDIEELEGTFDVNVDEELRSDQGDVLEGEEEDPERVAREAEPFPQLFPPVRANLSAAMSKAYAKIRQDTEKDAGNLIEEGNVPGAIALYTEAMRSSGATAMMLTTRATLLLRQRRPCAAIRDCTAALRINASMVKAYRVRGAAHRKLGHWRKALRDLSEAQGLKQDMATGELQRIVAAYVAKLDGTLKRNAALRPGEGVVPSRQGAGPSAPVMHYEATSLDLKDLDKGQAVVIEGLLRAPHLNGKRGVVERSDPRPAARGRWEVELRMDNGKLEVKSLKRENIVTLNKADKAACRNWAQEERKHREERRQREEQEEQEQYRKCVEAKFSKLSISAQTRKLLGALDPKKALAIIDKAGEASEKNLDEFLASQARRSLSEDSDDDCEEEGGGIYDPEEPPLKKQKSSSPV